MRKPLTLILGILLIGFTVVNMVCPLFYIDSRNAATYNLFDILEGSHFYKSSQIIGIIIFGFMVVGVALVLIGAITCFNDYHPLKVLSILGASILTGCSIGLMMFAIYSPVAFGDPGVTYGELYFISISVTSAFFIYNCCKNI